MNIVILTGAGISAESGVKTFRDNDGLWEGHDVQEVATPEAFRRNPVLVQRFYDERRRQVLSVKPNAAHLALARLEREHTGNVLVVTQNVDDLHERAGSHNVLHMHGELLSALCQAVSHTLTPKRGHILRHGPSKGAQGSEAALIDVAQDLLHTTEGTRRQQTRARLVNT